jgi:hypothetical protein
MNLSNAEIIALAKSTEKIAKQCKLTQGTYQVDTYVTVRLTGEVKKSADSYRTPTASIPLKATLALVLQYAGVTRERAAEILIQAMTAALEAGTDAAGEVNNYLADVDAAEARVQAITASLPKVPVSGQTRCDVEIEFIEARASVAA